MAERDIKDILLGAEPSIDQVKCDFTWQVKKHPTVVLRDGDFCPLTYENLYSLLKGQMAEYPQDLKQSTIQLDSSFFTSDPCTEHTEFDFYWTRTYIGVSSKEYHTAAKDISIENLEHFIGASSIESISEEDFDVLLKQQLQDINLPDQQYTIIRKIQKKTVDKSGDDEDEARTGRVFTRQDTLTKRLTGQGYIQVDQEVTETDSAQREKGAVEKKTSKLSKAELKKQSALKRSRCEPLLERLVALENRGKYLLSVANYNPQELWSHRKDVESLEYEHKLAVEETDRINAEWSSLPPVEGEDLVEDINELHTTITSQLVTLWQRFQSLPPPKDQKRKKYRLRLCVDTTVCVHG